MEAPRRLVQFARSLRWVTLLGVVFLAALPLAAQQSFIEDIKWEGLRRIPKDTMNARILSRIGDVFDPRAINRDLNAAWNTKFFEDVRIEVEDGEQPGGKIIYFVVSERPLIRRIKYVGNKSITKSDILERFRERRVGLTVEMSYDPTRVRRAEVELQRLLSERGRNFAKVTHITRRVPPNAIVLSFVIEEGPKVKVGKISFRGNQGISDGNLVRAMKLSRPLGIPPFWYFIHKTYHREKVLFDMNSLSEKYNELGYFRVNIQEPESRIRDTQPWLPLRVLPFLFKDGKAMDLRFTVEEGGRYRMGDLTIRSEDEKKVPLNDGKEARFIGGLNVAFLEASFPLRKGDIFDVTKVRKAIEDYTNLFSNFGFINFTALPDTDVDDDARVVNLSFDFELNKQFFVNRIEFTGNTSTRDKVIRRQILLEEGMVFSSRAWETSVLRLNQLGFFERLDPENAEVRQNAQEGTVDLSLKVKERGKNSIGLNGGTSGIFGSFIGLNYSTNNFMGLGETLSVDFQVGDRNTAFVVGFTEPYMFERPLQMGVTFTIRKFEFDQARETGIRTGQQNTITDPQLRSRLLNYDQNTIGVSVFASYPMRKWGFGRLGVNYSYSNSDITCATDACRDLFGGLAFRGLEGPSTLDGIKSSRVSGSYFYNTVNHPLFPTRGTSVFVAASFEGGPLGGNQKTIRPSLEFKHYRPMQKGRNTLAMRLQLGFVTGYGGFVPSPFNRFYIGGEQDIRGFDIQRITPLAFLPRLSRQPVIFVDPTRPDANGNPTSQTAVVDVLTQSLNFPGGDTQVVANVEYRIPLVGPVQLAVFLDAGVNMILRSSQLRVRTATLEDLRSLFPEAGVPDDLKIISGTNSKIRSSAGLELVINLPIIQAPFRFYWAYNVSRFNGNINRPASLIKENEDFPLPPGVLENQILPNLLLTPQFSDTLIPFVEPLKRFRFTISRTF